MFAALIVLNGLLNGFPVNPPYGGYGEARLLLLVRTYAPERPMGEVIPVPPKKIDWDVEGYYHVRGKEAGGKSYTGLCTIKKKGDVFLVQVMVDGAASYTGIGIRKGMVFAVGWSLPAAGGNLIRGLTLYDMLPREGKLSGSWATFPGPGLLQAETLTWLRALDEAPPDGE